MKKQPSIEELVARGISYSEQGLRSKAKDCFRRALEMLPGDPVISYNLALELMEDENWNESLALLDQAVNGEPDNPDFWCERGVVLFHLARYNEAEESYDLALAYGDESSRLWNNHGVLCFSCCRFEEAELYFRRAIELERDNADAWFNLADTLEERGNKKGAKEALRVFDRLLGEMEDDS